MNIKEALLETLAKKRTLTGKELADRFGVSRQALNVHLKALVEAGRVVKEGVTKGSVYRLSSSTRKEAPAPRFQRTYRLEGLQEDRVFEEASLFMNVRKHTARNVEDILRYAFTEMLNNAIDHSKSETCRVEFVLDPYKCSFWIRDFGIGLFHSIATRFRLPDEHDAIGELLKGKTTTMSTRHTGEGIFFASKAADTMSFRSHAICLLFDNLKKDTFVREAPSVRGTDVTFSIGRRSRRQLEAIFAEFAPERHDYRFEKTRVLVRMFQKDYVSRSEARRLLAGLDKFKEIELDFSGVVSLGQGFADEVFRVFAKAHPDISIQPLNARPALDAVLRHVIDNKTDR